MNRPTILIADDEEYIVDILGVLLEEEGYATLKAYDGAEAWSLANSSVPALVIADAMMPKLSGIELIKRLRENDATKHIPAILMSCVVQRSDDSGASHFLTKPFNLDTVIELVKSYAGAPKVGGRPSGKTEDASPD
jgi:CheY-like chemotaxis protein